METKIDQRFKESEEKTDKKFKDMETKIDQRFKEAEEKTDKKFKDMETKIDQRFKESEEKTDKKFKDMETKMDQRFKESEGKTDKKFKDIEDNMNQSFKRVEDKLDVVTNTNMAQILKTLNETRAELTEAKEGITEKLDEYIEKNEFEHKTFDCRLADLEIKYKYGKKL